MKITDEEFNEIKESVLNELLENGLFRSEKKDEKEYISLTIKGISHLEDLIDSVSKLILKTKPSWINLLTLNQLFLIQSELLKTMYEKPEFALLQMATEYKIGNLQILANDYIKLIELDLIELTPKNGMIH